MIILVDATALILVAGVGFAAHRASLCTVKAVAEVLTSGTAYVLASFGKAVLWAALVFGAVLLMLPAPAAGFVLHEPRWLLIAGAFIFGVGAAVNGGCSMSTLQRLADGDLRMAVTLCGFAAAALAASVFFTPRHGVRVAVAWEHLGAHGYALLGLLALWGAWELRRLWRARPDTIAWWRLPAAGTYRLSTAAALLGIIGGLLYGVKGAWSYTYYLRTEIDAAHRGVDGPPALHALLFGALFAGMAASALQRGTFSVETPGARAAIQHFAGGALMGVGASLVPGGNDTLMLVGLPTLSPWALGAYAALLAGIAIMLLAMCAYGGGLPRVTCPNDVCTLAPSVSASSDSVKT